MNRRSRCVESWACWVKVQPLLRSWMRCGGLNIEDMIRRVSPRWNAAGELIKKAIVTVFQNGIVVQDHVELTGCTDGIGAVPWKTLGNYERKHAPEVFVGLQYHNNPVRYRNIWVRSLHLPETPQAAGAAH